MLQFLYDDTLQNSIKYTFIFILSVPCIPIFMVSKFGFEFIELVFNQIFSGFYSFTDKLWCYVEIPKAYNKTFIRQAGISDNHSKKDRIILSKYAYAYITGVCLFNINELPIRCFFNLYDTHEYRVFLQYHHTFIVNKSLYDNVIIQHFYEAKSPLFRSAIELREYIFETKRKHYNIYKVFYLLENYNVFSYNKLVNKIGYFYLSDDIRMSYVYSIKSNPYLFHYYTRFDGVYFWPNSKFWINMDEWFWYNFYKQCLYLYPINLK
jgi:hypothetical protein